MLKQYLYISTAPDLPRETVEDILRASARNNPQAGITGLLLYNGRNFLQMIEGEESDLLSLMARIARDPRHSGILKLDDSEIAARNCPDWAMKRVPLAKSPEERQEEIGAMLPDGLSDGTKQIILNFAVLN